MDSHRTSYLATTALKSYLLVSVATAAANQLSMLTDGIVLGNLLGPTAISSLNLCLPISNIVYGISQCIMGGAAMVAARAVGQHNHKKVGRAFSVSTVYSTALLSIVALFSWLYMDKLLYLASPDPIYHPEIREYLSVNLICMPLTALCYGITRFMSTDGRTWHVGFFFFTSSMLNILFDWIAVGFFGWGMSGCAWATVASIVLAMFVYSKPIVSKERSFRFSWKDIAGSDRLFEQILSFGSLITMGSFFTAMIIYVINLIFIANTDESGFYIWSLCQQLFYVGLTILGCCSQAVYDVGGVFLGQGDTIGMKVICRKADMLLKLLIGILVLACFFVPQSIVWIFGGYAHPELMSLDLSVLGPFSIFLFMLYHCLMLERTALLQGYHGLTFYVLIVILISMLGIFYLIHLLQPSLLWWGFILTIPPIAAMQALANFYIFKREGGQCHPYTLMPIDDATTLWSASVNYKREDIEPRLQQLRQQLRLWCTSDETQDAMIKKCREMIEAFINIPNASPKYVLDIIVARNFSGRYQVSIRTKLPEGTWESLNCHIEGTEHHLLFRQDVIHLEFHENDYVNLDQD